jgi:multiple sugar transport system substrate-binding protein
VAVEGNGAPAGTRSRWRGVGRAVRAGWGDLQRAVQIHRVVTAAVLGLAAGITLTLFVQYLQPILVKPGELELGELVLLSGADVSAGGQRQVLIEQWNRLHPNNPVTVMEVPSETDAERSAMIGWAMSGRRVDVYNLDLIWLPEFAARGFLHPLDKSGVDIGGFLKAPLASCMYAGKLWGLPFNTDAGLLFYHKDLLDPAAPPPVNLPTLTSSAGAAMVRYGRAGQPGHAPELAAGYAGQLADYEGLTVNALEAIWAAGGQVVDDNGHVVIDSKATEGLRWLADGLANPTPQIVLPASRDSREPDSTESFRQHKVVFMRNWPVAYQQLRHDPGTEAVDDVEVTRLPGSSVLGGQNLVMASASRHQRAAQALIEFLTSERSQQILFERGGFAATREIIYRDPVITQQYPYAAILLEAIKSARQRPLTPHYQQFSVVFRRIVGQALDNHGELPDNAAATLTDALRGKVD